MGLSKTTSSAIWIGLSEGKFFIGKKSEAKEFYPAFEGLLIGIAFRDSEFQGVTRRDCILLFLDEGTKYKISFNVSSRTGKETLMKLVNCDVSQRIELCPTYEEKEGKKKGGMFVNQASGSLKQKWTKDNPGDLPQSKYIGKIKGVDTWDDAEQCEWLENYIMKNVAPLCLKNITNHPGETNHESGGDDEGSGPPADHQEATPKHADGDVPF